ncbi:MAG TPA: Amuc_1099 family pilus-like system protein [Chthoniobacterales bacterium]|jgi:hypothetical protein
MEWLRENYDRALAFAAALFLVLCLVFILFGVAGFRRRFSDRESVSLPNNNVAAGKSSRIVETMQKLQAPAQWETSSRSGLFVPEKHFSGANGEPTALRNAILHPPVPNEWLEEFALPMAEPDVLTQDPDRDGFTNRDEWDGRTNPIKRDSHPSYISKLRLRSSSEEPFPLIFSSSIGDVYAINNLDRRKPTQFLRLGEMVQGTKYKLTNYREKHAINKYGTTIDVSELTLEEIETRGVVRLVKEKPTISPESVANFLYTWGGTEQNFSVKKDQEFSLKPEEEVKYRLRDVLPDKAIVVLMAKPEEIIEIGLVGGAAPSPGM